MAKGRKAPTRYKALWVGDAVAHTGFSTVTHSVLDPLSRTWDVAVLGVNYYGDPHNFKYPIFPAQLGGDIYGVNRIGNLVDALQPDVVCVINDPWVCRDYIKPVKERGKKLALYMPIDSPNIRKDFVEPLNEADLLIGYTQFAIDEMQKTGITTNSTIIPHGIDLAFFSPMTKKEARAKVNIPEEWFVVGCVNRNQPRKRLDLMVEYFADFWKGQVVNRNPNVRLYWHGALQDLGWDIIQLAQYHGIENQLIITSPNMTPANGVPREMLKYIYGSFDVQFTTTLGEGWGLTQMEGAACRIPQIVPKWSALAEWMEGAAHFVDCTSTYVNTGGINTVGGVADKTQFIEAFEKIYLDSVYRNTLAQKAFTLVSNPKFRWESVAAQFDRAFRSLLT